MKLTNLGKELNHIINLNKLNNESIIVDAGAAVGDFVKKIHSYPHTQQCKIISLECSRKNLDKLNKLNLDNNIIVECALVGKKKEVIFSEFIGETKPDGNHKYYQWGNIMGNHKNKLKNKNVEINEYRVNTITLVSLMDKYKLGHIDYLKMDVEGAEYEIIENLSKAVASKIYQISMETHDTNKNSGLIKSLEYLGYKVQLFDGNEIYASR